MSFSATTAPRRHAPSAVMSTFASASLMRSLQRLRGEAAEHDRVRGADARAREHRGDGLGHHAHVDRDAVALARRRASRSSVRDAARLVEQVGVGDARGVAGLAFPVERDLVAVAGVRRGGRGSSPTTLSLPPTNHFANGSSHSRIVCHSCVPVERERLLGPEALPVAVGVVVDARVGDRARACGTPRGGGNVRPSCSSASSVSAMRSPPLVMRRRATAATPRRRCTRVERRTTRCAPRPAGSVSAAASVDAAAAGERFEVADARRARPRCRRPSATSVVDAEVAQPVGLVGRRATREARVGRGVRSCSSTTSAVMSLLPGRVERIAAGRVRAVGAQPARAARRACSAIGVDRSRRRARRSRGAASPRTPRNQSSSPRGIGSRVAGREREPAVDARERRRVGRLRGHEHLDEVAVGVERRPAPRSSRAPSQLARCRTAGCRAARWRARPAVELDARAARRARRTPGRAPAPGTGCVVVGAARRTGRAPRRPARARSRSRCSVAQRRRALDEHVAQRGAGTRARRAAPRARAGRCPRPPRPPGTGRARSSASPAAGRARAPTHAPNSGPTSGLVTKSRPARPAPWPRAKKPPSP